MARRKKKKSDDLKLPEFDETDFMRKEMKHAIMMVSTVGLSIFMALIAAVLTWTLKDARIPFVLGLLGIFLLKFVFDLLKIDTNNIEKMKWLGTGFTYFLTFIAIWVLLINPPVIDMIEPSIADATPDEQELGADIGVSVLVDDNQGIDDVNVLINDPDGNETGPFEMEKIGRNKYWYPIPSPKLGKYEYTVSVRDKGDFLNDATFDFLVVPHEPPTISLLHIVNGTSMGPGDTVNFQIIDNTGIMLAWYSLDEDYDIGDPQAKETKFKFKKTTKDKDNENIRLRTKDEVVTVKIPNKWQGTSITITVCAMDAVPHSTVYQAFTFPIR